MGAVLSPSYSVHSMQPHIPFLSSQLTITQIEAIFRTIGNVLMAIVNGIGAILRAIIDGIVAFFDIIISCLTCRFGSRRHRSRTTTRSTV